MEWPTHCAKTQTVREFDFGRLEMTQWDMGKILLGYVDAHYTRRDVYVAQHNDAWVRLHVGLKGECDFYHKQLNRLYKGITGHHNLMFSEGFEIHIENKSLHIETFGINIERQTFLQLVKGWGGPIEAFAHQVAAGEAAILSQDWKFSSVPIRRLIHEMVTCQLTQGALASFMVAKTIEMLLMQNQAYTPMAKSQPRIRTRTDREALIEARDLLLARMDCPPTLAEIAKKVGLNQTKLKSAFKEAFGDTLFGFLAKQRLQKAHQLLLETDKSASEIALELGFSSPQHFSKAFKAQFGITTGDMKKRTADIQKSIQDA
jgi:AraC-like DNA-binding protein